MGFTEQGEGLLQDHPAGTGTRKLSGVAPPPPAPVWKGLLSSFHTWEGFPGQKAVAGKGSRGLWNERESSSGALREDTATSEGWGLRQAFNPSELEKQRRGGFRVQTQRQETR